MACPAKRPLPQRGGWRDAKRSRANVGSSAEAQPVASVASTPDAPSGASSAGVSSTPTDVGASSAGASSAPTDVGASSAGTSSTPSDFGAAVERRRRPGLRLDHLEDDEHGAGDCAAPAPQVAPLSPPQEPQRALCPAAGHRGKL